MAFLLDTCTVLWMADDYRLISAAAHAAIACAQDLDEAFVSPVTAWEIGMLKVSGKLKIDIPVESFIAPIFDGSRFQLAPLTPHIALQASFLPGELHRDPADRMLVATARELGMTLVTRDEKLLAYGRAGHVRTLVC